MAEVSVNESPLAQVPVEAPAAHPAALPDVTALPVEGEAQVVEDLPKVDVRDGDSQAAEIEQSKDQSANQSGDQEQPGEEAAEDDAAGPEEVSEDGPEAPEGPDLSDDVDVRAYEEDPDPTEEYDEDGGFVVKDADVEAVIADEVVLHTAAEITVRNVLPEGEKRKRRPPERYEPVETPLDDADRPTKRRKTTSSRSQEVEEQEDGEGDEEGDEEDEEDEAGDEEEGDEEEDEEEGDETDEEYVAGSTESEESESEESDEGEEDEPINIVD